MTNRRNDNSVKGSQAFPQIRGRI